MVRKRIREGKVRCPKEGGREVVVSQKCSKCENYRASVKRDEHRKVVGSMHCCPPPKEG